MIDQRINDIDFAALAENLRREHHFTNGPIHGCDIEERLPIEYRGYPELLDEVERVLVDIGVLEVNQNVPTNMGRWYKLKPRGR